MSYFESFDDALRYFYNSGYYDNCPSKDARDYYWSCNDSERKELDNNYNKGKIDRENI